MPTILLTNSYPQDVLDLVNSLLPKNFNLLSLNKIDAQELKEKAAFADYFLASGRLQINKEIISAASKLKMIQRTGVGIDGLDLNELKEKNIPVYINKGINAQSVAEHTILLILSVLRRIVEIDTLVKNGVWKKNAHGLKTHSLKDKTVGLIGLGEIGINVAKMLRPFGCKVNYYKPSQISVEVEKELGINYIPFNDLIKGSDIISLHCSLNENTFNLINANAFKKMKKGVFLINTARGSIVNENDLIASIKNGQVAGAGLDVFESEPIQNDNELLKLDNVVVSSHVSGLTIETYTTMIQNAFDNINQFELGEVEALQKKRLI